MIDIVVGDKEYKVKEAKTPEERAKGLSGIKELPQDEGMLFYMDDSNPSFWMKDTLIPLDIVFINEDNEVISVHEGKPNDETPITESGVKYVLEVNTKSGIEEGDDFDFVTSDNKMLVLDSNGEIQMELEGGERIFSRKSTKVLIKKAKKAKAVEGDEEKFKRACKSLGKYLFKELRAQDSRPPEYVDNPNKEQENKSE